MSFESSCRRNLPPLLNIFFLRVLKLYRLQSYLRLSIKSPLCKTKPNNYRRWSHLIVKIIIQDNPQPRMYYCIRKPASVCLAIKSATPPSSAGVLSMWVDIFAKLQQLRVFNMEIQSTPKQPINDIHLLSFVFPPRNLSQETQTHNTRDGNF